MRKGRVETENAYVTPARLLDYKPTLATGKRAMLSTSSKETGQQELSPKAKRRGVEGSQSMHHTGSRFIWM